MIEFLTNVCNAIIKIEKYPDVFKKGLIIPLYKGGKRDVFIMTSFRGITIQSVLCKIFDSVLYKRSEEFIKENLAIRDTQSACT